MRIVKVHEAKTQFSKLLADVEQGEEIIVQRGDNPIAKLVPFPVVRKRELGVFEGQIWIADDFDQLPSEFDEYMR